MYVLTLGATEPSHVADAITVAAALEPITLADAKKHLRVDVDDENDQIVNWIRAATRQVEQDTGLALMTQTRTRALDAFPTSRLSIELVAPLQTVSHVKYYDSTGTLQTMASSGYVVDTASVPGRIGLADDGAWPSDVRTFQPGIVTYVCGWTSAILVPETLRHAVRR